MALATNIQRSFEIDDFEIKRTAKGRTVTAYAAVFDQEAEIRDQHGHYLETINRSAFNRTLSHGIGKVNVFYNHGYDLSGRPNGLLAVPFATPEDIKPDGRGLLTISRYNDGELADAILAAWDGGQIKGQSFRGRVFQSAPPRRGAGLPVIERTELGLKEYGPTHSPAYEGAGLVAIRSQDELAELIRSMISEMAGTPQASPATSVTPDPGSGATGDSPTGHSSRITHARRNVMRMRALDLGVIKDEAP
jgi:HK97 family phage prohead protease